MLTWSSYDIPIHTRRIHERPGVRTRRDVAHAGIGCPPRRLPGRIAVMRGQLTGTEPPTGPEAAVAGRRLRARLRTTTAPEPSTAHGPIHGDRRTWRRPRPGRPGRQRPPRTRCRPGWPTRSPPPWPTSPATPTPGRPGPRSPPGTAARRRGAAHRRRRRGASCCSPRRCAAYAGRWWCTRSSPSRRPRCGPPGTAVERVLLRRRTTASGSTRPGCRPTPTWS